jgi:Ca-activated chloride channel family protein
MSLAHPLLLWLLMPLGLWAAWSLRDAPRLLAPGARLRHPAIAGSPTAPTARSRAVPLLRVAALALLVVALARPQQPGDWIVPPPTGRDIALVIDVSGSMGLADFALDGVAVSRLDMVKRLLGEFVAARPADRFALAVYGSSAATLTPPTHDRDHVLRQVARLQPGVLGDWSALGDALGLAVRSVRHDGLRPAVIFIGDGDPANSGTVHPGEALAVAMERGVAIHALQIGPGPADAGEAFDGEPQPRFADIARLSGGRYAAVTDGADARAFLRLIDRIEPTLPAPVDSRQMREWYAVPAGLALLLLLLARVREARSGADA